MFKRSKHWTYSKLLPNGSIPLRMRCLKLSHWLSTTLIHIKWSRTINFISVFYLTPKIVQGKKNIEKKTSDNYIQCSAAKPSNMWCGRWCHNCVRCESLFLLYVFSFCVFKHAKIGVYLPCVWMYVVVWQQFALRGIRFITIIDPVRVLFCSGLNWRWFVQFSWNEQLPCFSDFTLC